MTKVIYKVRLIEGVTPKTKITEIAKFRVLELAQEYCKTIKADTNKNTLIDIKAISLKTGRQITNYRSDMVFQGEIGA
tara:strand:- start:1771 stop:2004 length:234 start_codon:yes stop_codon:yes gene_type:complete